MLPCEVHYACQVTNENELEIHSVQCEFCGHYYCEGGSHEELECGHHACEDGDHTEASCGEKEHFNCDGRDHSLLPCGEHYACELSEIDDPEEHMAPHKP